MPFWKCFSCIRFPNEENITKLDYSNGTLTDVPPDVSQFERTLEELNLSSNRISDLPPELFYCQGIRVLKLNDNELETIPNAIGSLRQLQILDLSRNGLTYIPDNVKSCKHLTHLDLSLNTLHRLPDVITNLISLQGLLLNETYLEFLPANFGRLVNLKILELRSNSLVTLPKSMARLTDLVRIDIGANEFTELPEVIGLLTQLRELWVDYNRIRRISGNVSNLRELIHFEANSNQLSCLPNEISHWRNLEVLSLSVNDIETLPFSIGMLKRLTTLKCDSNQLRELPDSICHLESLEELVIDHNYIMRLPSTIGLLRKLRFLAADDNLLRRLPDEICSCASLSVLSLRGNKIVELPYDIGHLTNLHVLNIVNNCIAYFPVSLLNLSNLTALWISDNQSQPLVPLQYLDGNTKAQLTCFMLPQIGFSADSARQKQHIDYGKNSLAPEISDTGSINSWMPQQNSVLPQSMPQQQQQQRESCNTLQVNSPSRRICFADESHSRSSGPITTRLMRSPTPYPKELRLMAKYVKNINQNTNNYRSEMVGLSKLNDTIDVDRFNNDPQVSVCIKEARVLANPGGGITNCTYSNEVPDDCPLPSNKNISDCDTPSAQTNCFYNNTLKTTDINFSNYMNLRRSPLTSSTDPYDTYDDHTSLSPIQAQDVHHHHNYVEYNILPIFNSGISQQPQDPSNWKNSTSEIRMANPFHVTNIHSHHSPVGAGRAVAYPVQRQPPPYHIAKAFTKKSREDLLSYDSLRNQSEHRNGSIQDEIGVNDDYFDDSRDEGVETVACDKYEIDANSNANNFDNLKVNESQDHHCSEINCVRKHADGVIGNNSNNNNGGNGSTSSSSTTHTFNSNNNGSEEPNGHSSSSLIVTKNCSSDISNSPEFQNGYGDGDDDDEYHNYHHVQQQQLDVKSFSKSSSQWLFGLHRNPTVKQIIIKKDPVLGFEIKEIPNQGIFVSITIPNTPASTLLRVDDKILDVDGFDFTKVSLDEARQILIDTGPIFNIMISRK